MGSFGAANNKDALKSKNITHILTVANSLAPAHRDDFIYKVIGGLVLHPSTDEFISPGYP